MRWINLSPSFTDHTPLVFGRGGLPAFKNSDGRTTMLLHPRTSPLVLHRASLVCLLSPDPPPPSTVSSWEYGKCRDAFISGGRLDKNRVTYIHGGAGRQDNPFSHPLGLFGHRPYNRACDQLRCALAASIAVRKSLCAGAQARMFTNRCTQSRCNPTAGQLHRRCDGSTYFEN